MSYRAMMEDGYIGVLGFDDPEMSRIEYLGEHIFNFTTYDSEMSELFARKAIEVCAAISSGTTFDYIKDPEQYRWFLLMCNMPFFSDKLSWGTSIRGAWWDDPAHGRIKFSSCGLWLNGEQMADEWSFTRGDWVEFIAAVLAFAENSEAKQ